MVDKIILKKAFANIKQDIKRQDLELEKLKKFNSKLLKEIKILREDIKIRSIRGSTKLEKEVMKKFNRSKKEIIKHKILEVIKTRQVTVPELKEIIVDQEEYCSKASFYRYLEEIKDLTYTKKDKLITFSRI